MEFLIFYAFGVLKRKEYVEVFKRRIDWELINKALAIVVISILYIAVIITILLSIENFSTDRVIYEVISAFSTTGLSMGITASLGIIIKVSNNYYNVYRKIRTYDSCIGFYK